MERTQARSAVAEKLDQVMREWSRKLLTNYLRLNPKKPYQNYWLSHHERESDKIPSPVLYFFMRRPFAVAPIEN